MLGHLGIASFTWLRSWASLIDLSVLDTVLPVRISLNLTCLLFVGTGASIILILRVSELATVEVVI